MKKLKSNIGWMVDRSPYDREFLMKRYKKSRNTISNWCTGKNYPSAPELFDLAELFNVKVDDLYDIIED
ncbi:helix-turn-helix transcriptional regulator [Bacillus litorisediminis]|uniref:helix-turn-helix transcriptional regulator n=1 Tax=Bacillus litorisediminis TaxID=2922713 RepID=UPI001FAEB44C|nr:helix-turn-helix transcriptional regulator [Bacillus litorisediminis]